VTELTADLQALVVAARDVREHAYAPYSRFLVGAALRSDDGAVYSGCNVENASYGATICAERNAVLGMVAHAARPAQASRSWRPRISAVAVFTDAPTLAMPCGMCRQVLAEFERDALVVIANPREQRVLPFAELFPEPFVLAPDEAER
jgi:cytidine deaminase